jgi:hypothetical protein
MDRQRLIAFLQLRWLGIERVRAYGWILALAGALSLWHFWVRAMGADGSDFQAFWSAAWLTVQGRPEAAYDLEALAGVGREIGRSEVFAFVNPPPFMLPIAPLGWLPYPLAWWVWIAVSFGLWLAVSRRFVPGYTGAVAGFPGALIAAWHAQTGLFMSALQAGAAVLLEKRPFVAGLCVGALVMKPHLAVLFPVAFLAGRHWRAIAGAACGALGLLVLAWMTLGTQTMLAYPESWKASRSLIEFGSADFFLRQCTVYAAVRVAAGPLVATFAQGAASLLAAVAVWYAWRRDWSIEAKFAVLFAATPLATPYLFNYDLPFLVLPVIWLAAQARRQPTGPWERVQLLALYFAPLVTRVLASLVGLNLMPWVSIWLLVVVMRRAPLPEPCRNAT